MSQSVFQSPATQQTGNGMGTSARLALPLASEAGRILATLQTRSQEVSGSSHPRRTSKNSKQPTEPQPGLSGGGAANPTLLSFVMCCALKYAKPPRTPKHATSPPVPPGSSQSTNQRAPSLLPAQTTCSAGLALSTQRTHVQNALLLTGERRQHPGSGFRPRRRQRLLTS